MRYSYKFSDAIHLLAYLVVYRDGDRSSKAIANSIEANPSAVRKLMADLRQAGLLVTQTGRAQPTLAKDPATISLLDIYQALQSRASIGQTAAAGLFQAACCCVTILLANFIVSKLDPDSAII